jgi:hypothetical protein
MFKKGEKVAVCYDAKWSRAVEGIVLTEGEKQFTIQFKPWANDEAGFIRLTVRKYKTLICREYPKLGYNEGYGGYLKGNGELGIIRMLGGNGDWYSVYKLRRLKRNHYKVAKYDR